MNGDWRNSVWARWGVVLVVVLTLTGQAVLLGFAAVNSGDLPPRKSLPVWFQWCLLGLCLKNCLTAFSWHSWFADRHRPHP